MFDQIALIIPAFCPEDILIKYIGECIQAGFCHIVVVDDGSGEAYRRLFAELESRAEVTALRHEVNQGKGRALKTAFRYCLDQKDWKLTGVITADADGQHRLKDICKIAEAMSDALLLGCRSLQRKDIPFKSRFGNGLTKWVFGLLYGKLLTDTQTGLRGIPAAFLEDFCEISGERYEYETAMLIYAVRKKLPIKEIPIETIYIDENSGTHFRPVIDSLKIYALMMKSFFLYVFSSLSASILDFGLFFLFSHLLLADLPLTGRIIAATAAARIGSSLYNFQMNRVVAFGAGGNAEKQLARYYALAAVQAAASAGLVAFFCRLIPVTDVFIKAAVDVFLFLFSFQIQKNWVFREKKA